MRRCAALCRKRRSGPASSMSFYEAFLDAVELQGKDRDILEDIKATPVTYATIVKGSLALGPACNQAQRVKARTLAC